MPKPRKSELGRGRPSLYTPDLAEEIARRLSDGEPLAVICRDAHMPCDNTVRSWAEKDEAFAATIARARDAGHDAIALRARLTIRGKTEAEGGESSGDVQRDKAIVELDLKLLAKWNPKKYGDKVDVNHGGEVGMRVVRKMYALPVARSEPVE